jgi:hypothetical protein
VSAVARQLPKLAGPVRTWSAAQGMTPPSPHVSPVQAGRHAVDAASVPSGRKIRLARGFPRLHVARPYVMGGLAACHLSWAGCQRPEAYRSALAGEALLRSWCSGNMQPCRGCVPGSSPGDRSGRYGSEPGGFSLQKHGIGRGLGDSPCQRSPLRTWRNGIRAGLRRQCPQGREGSNPSGRTVEAWTARETVP